MSEVEKAIELICESLGGNKIELSDASDGGKYLVVFRAFDHEFVCDTSEFEKVNSALHMLAQMEVVK